MFICEISGKVSKPRERSYKIATKTRPKTYYGPLKDEDGKIVYQTDDNRNLIKDDNGKPMPVMIKVAVGIEVIKEITVSEESFMAYMADQNQKAFG